MAGPCAGGQTVPRLRHLAERTLGLLECVPLSIHLLLFRLAIASVFLPAGFLKLASWASTIALFQDEYKVPVLPPILAATLATTFEIGCSALLIAGLTTRLATLPLFGQIVTIQLFVYPQAWHEHLVWGAILLFLLTRGAGTVSLDHLISRWLGLRA
jgi:putative oxidoreductase